MGFLIVSAFVAVASTCLLLFSSAFATAQDEVEAGAFHSLSGTMAISETSLKDVVLMAIGEINATDGVLGKKIVPVVADRASNWDLGHRWSLVRASKWEHHP